MLRDSWRKATKLQATSKPTKILPVGKVTGRCERANAVPPCETPAQKFAPPSGFGVMPSALG